MTVIVRVEVEEKEIEELLEKIRKALSFVEKDDVFRMMLNKKIDNEAGNEVERYKRLIEALRKTIEQVEDIEKTIDIEKAIRRLEVIP
ncbi:hypothetical protein [Thermococcus sp.]